MPVFVEVYNRPAKCCSFQRSPCQHLKKFLAAFLATPSLFPFPPFPILSSRWSSSTWDVAVMTSLRPTAIAVGGDAVLHRDDHPLVSFALRSYEERRQAKVEDGCDLSLQHHCPADQNQAFPHVFQEDSWSSRVGHALC